MQISVLNNKQIRQFIRHDIYIIISRLHLGFLDKIQSVNLEYKYIYIIFVFPNLKTEMIIFSNHICRESAAVAVADSSLIEVTDVFMSH